MAEIEATIHNWRQFCEEPELSDAELEEWSGFAKAIGDDSSLYMEAWDATREEWDDYLDAGRHNTDDYKGSAAGADAYRRLVRAEIEWWRAHVPS